MEQDTQDTTVATATAPEPEAPAEGLVPDEVLQRQVAQRQAAREQRTLDAEGDGEVRPTTEVLKQVQADGPANPVEIANALDFFLATKDDADAKLEPVELRLNLGTKDKPRWVGWTIGPVEDGEITRIRKESVKGTRAQRRRGDAEVDEMLVSRRLVVRGTLDPDPVELAKAMNLVDPADAVQNFFRRYGKTGLITQISGEILSISGWDDEDIQEVEAARG